MADEISVTIRSTLSNGELPDRFNPGNKKYDQGTAEAFSNTATVTTDSTTISQGAVQGNSGWIFLTNLSTANEVFYGPTSDVQGSRLQPSASVAHQLVSDSTVTMASTSGATAEVFYKIWST